MKLDPRIIEGKKPLTPFDTEMAKQFIGKRCYFASKFENFKNLSDVPQAILQNVDGSSTPFQCYGAADIPCYDCFILPLEWVKKEKPKKYRAFTNEEFLNLFDTGKLHSIRRKNEQGRYIITDVYFNGETIFVKLNCDGIGLAMRHLVNNGYEYFDGKDWTPFGEEE